ncbi:MAG: nuclease A inhibitor family protein [Crinalium sp.]
MKPHNAELFQQLREITKNLIFSSQSDDKFEPFMWETDQQGNMTLEKFLQSEGFLFPLRANTLIEFVSSSASWSSSGSSTPNEVARKMSLKYTEILDFLNAHMKMLEIYLVSNLGQENSTIRKEAVKTSRIGNPNFYSLSVDKLHDSYKRGETCVEQEAFHIIVCETFEGEWLGIVPRMSCGGSIKGGQRFVLSEPLVTENTIKIKQNLSELILELEFTVIEYLAFYRKQQAIVETGSIKEELLYRLLGSVGFFRAFTFEDYFNEDWRNYHQFRPLDEFLRSNLTNLQEYIVGLNARYFIYSIGQTEEKDVLGVSTMATWG